MIDVLAAHLIVFFRLFAAGEAKVRLVFAVRVHLATLIRNVRARTAAILRDYHAFIHLILAIELHMPAPALSGNMSASTSWMDLFTRLSVGRSMARAWVLQQIRWLLARLLAGQMTRMVWMLLTVVSRALISQTVLCNASFMRLVRVAVGCSAATSPTAATMTMRSSRVMPSQVLLDAILLLHGQSITFKSMRCLMSILIVVVIEFIIVLIFLIVAVGISLLSHRFLPLLLLLQGSKRSVWVSTDVALLL